MLGESHWIGDVIRIFPVCNLISVLQDIVVSLVLAVVVNISGILGAYMASEWTRVISDDVDSITPVRNSLIALAVSLLYYIILIYCMGTVHCTV